jgi:hypothetical protein
MVSRVGSSKVKEKHLKNDVGENTRSFSRGKHFFNIHIEAR